MMTVAVGLQSAREMTITETVVTSPVYPNNLGMVTSPVHLTALVECLSLTLIAKFYDKTSSKSRQRFKKTRPGQE